MPVSRIIPAWGGAGEGHPNSLSKSVKKDHKTYHLFLKWRINEENEPMEHSIQTHDEIISQIYFIRGRKVMLDSDLARIFGVTTARLNQQVRSNLDRFPLDFMFELSGEEYQNLILQIATSSLRVTENTNLLSQNATSSLIGACFSCAPGTCHSEGRTPGTDWL